MPRRDGTGPMGAGSMTGRGLGLCAGDNAIPCGAGAGFGPGLALGFACRRGFGRGFARGYAVNQASFRTQKELLLEQRGALQNRLEAINKQLENV